MTQKLKLTPQAVGSIMMAMQKGIKAAAENRPKEECDITKILLGFELEDTVNGLVVNNAPLLHYDDIVEVEEGQSN